MIDLFCVFTTGGVLLFSKAIAALKFDVVDIFIKNVLLKKTTSETTYRNGEYCVAYRMANDIGLIFCAVYQEAFNLLYIDDLLELAKEAFINNIWNEIKKEGNMIMSYPPFDKHYADSESKWMERCKVQEKKAKVMRTFADTSKGKEVAKKSGKKPSKSSSTKTLQEGSSNQRDTKEAEEEEERRELEELEKNRAALAKKFSGKGKSNQSPQKEEPAIIKKKDSRMWNVAENANAKEMDRLDVYSSLHGKQGDNIKSNIEQFMGKDTEKEAETMKVFVDSDYSSDDEEEEKKPKSSLFGRLRSGIQNITGKKTLTNEDLESIMAKFREDLMAKNVAQEVSVKLCESLKKSLIDTKTQAFTSIQKTVKTALEESLTSILTSKKKIDLISEISRKKDRKEPYSIVFIGVNGVGKSTNLAKVAYLLKSHNFKVMLAACDNFRAGAVEQIKTHGRCLEVPVFERGYKEDSAVIAQKALKEAASTGMDVVLIDTAGRMQNNEPLMKSLGRLVSLNNPDLILFIGEAIAGNDGVDQLTNFNKSLIDNSPQNAVREIDGVVLSKFDTVDDKMGAAISMTYTTGKPILFVGVGQKYTHLRKLNVKTVVKALLS